MYADEQVLHNPCICFFAVHDYMRRLFDHGPTKLFWIDTLHDLASFLVASTILSLWR